MNQQYECQCSWCVYRRRIFRYREYKFVYRDGREEMHKVQVEVLPASIAVPSVWKIMDASPPMDGSMAPSRYAIERIFMRMEYALSPTVYWFEFHEAK